MCGGGLGVGGGGRCNNVLSHAFRGLCFSLLVTTVLMLRCENSPVRSMTLLTLRCACTRHALLMLRFESSLVRSTKLLMLRWKGSLACTLYDALDVPLWKFFCTLYDALDATL